MKSDDSTQFEYLGLKNTEWILRGFEFRYLKLEKRLIGARPAGRLVAAAP